MAWLDLGPAIAQRLTAANVPAEFIARYEQTDALRARIGEPFLAVGVIYAGYAASAIVHDTITTVQQTWHTTVVQWDSGDVAAAGALLDQVIAALHGRAVAKGFTPLALASAPPPEHLAGESRYPLAWTAEQQVCVE